MFSGAVFTNIPPKWQENRLKKKPATTPRHHTTSYHKIEAETLRCFTCSLTWIRDHNHQLITIVNVVTTKTTTTAHKKSVLGQQRHNHLVSLISLVDNSYARKTHLVCSARGFSWALMAQQMPCTFYLPLCLFASKASLTGFVGYEKSIQFHARSLKRDVQISGTRLNLKMNFLGNNVCKEQKMEKTNTWRANKYT